MKTAVRRAIDREVDLNPSKMEMISKRACEDYYHFPSNEADISVPNEENVSLDEVAAVIAQAHESYIEFVKRINHVMENTIYGIGGNIG